MAYKASERYNEVIYSQDARNRIRIWFNEVELEDADIYCEKLTVSSRILPNGSQTFSLNNLTSQELTLVLHDLDIETIKDQVKISLGTMIEEDIYEDIPLGVYNIQDSPITDKNKITIKLRDNSVKLDFNYNGKDLIELNGGSATKLQILNDICEKANIKTKVEWFEGCEEKVGIYDSTISGRVYVKRLAEASGYVPIIDRDGDLDFVLVKADKLTTSGSPLQLTNSIGKPLLGLNIDGNSEQETRSGKNLLPANNGTETINGITFTKNNDGTITANGTATDGINYYINKDVYTNIPIGTYTLSDGVGISGGEDGTTYFMFLDGSPDNNSTINQQTFTLDTPTEIRGRIVVRSGVTLNKVIFKPMLEKGSTATEYEAFGVSPSPDYPSELEVVEGYNLYNPNTDTIGKVILDSGELADSGVWTTTDFMQINKNKINVSFNNSKIDNVIVAEFDKNKTYIKRQVTPQTIEKSNLYFTLSDTTKYIRFCFKNDQTITNIQIVEGNYKPYVPYGNLGLKVKTEQLYNVNDIQRISSEGVTIDNENWITITRNNTTGNASFRDLFNNFNMDLKENTKYKVVLEIKEFTQQDNTLGSYITILGVENVTQFKNQIVLKFNNMKTGVFVYDIFTKDSFENSTMSARNFVGVSAGDSVSITFRLSILEDTSITADTFTYKPYQEKITYLDLKGNFIGKHNDVKDELSLVGNKVILKKKLGKVVFNGSEIDWWNDDLYNGIYQYSHPLNPKAKYNDSYVIINAISNRFKGVPFEDSWLIDNVITTVSSQGRIRIMSSEIASVDDLKTWLIENNLTVYYVLAEPYEVDLGTIDIETFEGGNNISLLSSLDTNMSCEYYNEKEPINIPIELVEKYSNGEEYKVGYVEFEDAIRHFDAGSKEDGDNLFINSDNPYISKQEDIDNIYKNTKDFKINSFKTGKILGNPSIDPWDLIEIIDEDKKFTTLATNNLTYNGVFTHTFDTQITKEARKENVSVRSEPTFKKWAKTTIDNVQAQVEINVGKVETIEATQNDNYNEIINKFNDYTPSSKTLEIENSVKTLQTDTYTKTEINTKLTDGSVTKVMTTSGTFDENGMTYEKTNAPTKTTINEVGVDVKSSNSFNNKSLLFAGYVDDNNEQYSDYRGQTIVATDNIIVTHYLVEGSHTRVEDFVDEEGNECTADFFLD